MTNAFAQGVRACVRESVLAELDPELAKQVDRERVGTVRVYGSHRAPEDRRYMLVFAEDGPRPAFNTGWVFQARHLELAAVTNSLRIQIGPGMPRVSAQLAAFRLDKRKLKLLDDDQAAIEHAHKRGYYANGASELARKRLIANISRLIHGKT